MNCNIIKPGSFHIQGLFTVQKLNKLIEQIGHIEFHEKNDSQLYSCHVAHFSPQEFGVDKEFRLLGTLLSKIYNISYSLNQGMELIWMKKGDFLATHIDQHTSLQAVLYLTNTKTLNGGNFMLEDIALYPELGDVVIFSGSTEHSVPEILSDQNRYTLSFGFTGLT